MAHDEQLDEKPLDPEMEKVRRKMVRLLAISIGIMFIGLMAVLGAIVYKFAFRDAVVEETGSAPSSVMPSEAIAALPQGFTVESVALDGSRIGFFGRAADGSQRLIVLDLTTSRIVSDIVVVNR